MKSLRPLAVLAASAAIALVPATALAQRQAPTPDQRLERLERQMQQVQRQLFPKGRPADTAGFSDEPAATQAAVATLDQRLDALERQMAELLRQSEENGHRLQAVESEAAKARSDQEQRISALEQRVDAAAVAVPAPAQPPEAAAEPRPAPGRLARPAPRIAEAGNAQLPPAADAGAATDPGEDAYTVGFKLWEAGQYDQAIASLKSFVAAYPKHRRVSYANNLIGRSLLSKGQYREAAAVLLANYRANPGGERAGDSLYYLGQATLKLDQPEQACRVYEEFDAIYGAKARADLRKQVADAKAQAQCH